MGSKIEWTEETWNPIVGCTRCSEGCDHCYAVPTVFRGEAMGTVQHAGLVVRSESGDLDWTGEIRFVEHLLEQPLSWKKPRKVFVNSLSDLFAAEVPDDVIHKVLAVMTLAPHHTYQVLTKRPQRMASFMSDPSTPGLVARAADWISAQREIRKMGDERHAPIQWADTFEWPLPCLWLGTSIESDRWTWRANHLRRTPAVVRFISAEPLLTGLPSLDLTDIDWLLIGGESGADARPMHPQWARDLIDRAAETGEKFCGDCGDRIVLGFDGEYVHCKSVAGHDYDHRAVNDGTGTDRCAVLFKQWGSWHPERLREASNLGYSGPKCRLMYSSNHAANYELERGIYMIRGSKKAAGREIDGREWNEYPKVAMSRGAE